MGNVISIFSKTKRPLEPEKDMEGYLSDEFHAAGYSLKSSFLKEWDAEANLWRLRVTVQYKSKDDPEDMVFWYAGDDPQFAVSVPVGEPVSHLQADRIQANG